MCTSSGDAAAHRVARTDAEYLRRSTTTFSALSASCISSNELTPPLHSLLNCSHLHLHCPHLLPEPLKPVEQHQPMLGVHPRGVIPRDSWRDGGARARSCTGHALPSAAKSGITLREVVVTWHPSGLGCCGVTFPPNGVLRGESISPAQGRSALNTHRATTKNGGAATHCLGGQTREEFA